MYESSTDSVTPQANCKALFEKLDPYQREVAKWKPADGNLKVAATAGAGKTTSVVALVAQLVYSGTVKPSRIIVTTFTNKAAGELKERLKAVLPGDMFAQIRVGTFHSLALKAVRGPGGWNLSRCLDTGQKTRASELLWPPMLWRKIVKERKKIPFVDAKGLGLKKDERTFQMAMDVMRCEGITRRDWLSDRAIRKESNIRDLPTAWALYEQYKKASNSWDFADVLHKWWEKHREAPVGSQSADVVIVDEGQDNDFVQLDIARMLVDAEVEWTGYRALVRHPAVRTRIRETTGKGRLILVGDGSQGIYPWRGAYPELFQNAEKVLNAKQLILPNNYRSKPDIVNLGNRVIENRKWAAGMQANPTRSNREGSDRSVLQCKTDFPSEMAEAAWVAEEIKARIDAGANPSEFAVLCRTNASLGAFQAELITRHVPLVMLGGKSLFSYKEAQAVLGYLVLSDASLEGQDSVWPLLLQALAQCCNKPLRYLGGKFISECKSTTGSTIPEVIQKVARGLSRGSRRKAFELADTIESLRDMPWSKAIEHVQTLLIDWVEDDAEQEDNDPDEDRPGIYRVACEVAEKFDNAQDLLVFVHRCQTGTAEIGQHQTIPEGRVTLSTIHRVKGLEFRHVFLPASEGQLPHWRNVPAGNQDEKRVYDGKGIEEELRLFYVALTRAQDFLTLTASAQPRSPRKLSGTSRFILRYLLDEQVG